MAFSAGADPSVLYQPLPKDSIRILRLKGTSLVGNDDGSPQDLAILCDMQITKLTPNDSGKTMAYSALSYVWGSPKFPRWLKCNEVLKPIGPNLYDALWHLTFSKDAPTWLWVDALCINQEDNGEKGRQVAMMGHIYRQADLVTVWLGTNPNNNPSLEAFWQKLLSSQGGFNAMAELNNQDKTALLSGVHFLAETEWFNRVWTFQEIVLASRTRVWCGFHNFDWSQLTALVEWIRKSYGFDRDRPKLSRPDDSDDDDASSMASSHRTGDISQAFKVFHSLTTISSCMSSVDAIGLYGLVTRTSQRQSTDSRDQIFGLLGVWKHGPRITPNYDERVSLAHAKAVYEIFNEEGWLWLNLRNIPKIKKPIFTRCLREPRTRQYMLQVPQRTTPVSWIPVFSDQNAEEPRWKGTESGGHWAQTWRNQGTYAPKLTLECLNPSYSPSISIRGTTLQAKGIILGTWSRHYALGQARWQYNGAPGVFEGFPQCVVDSNSLGSDINVPSGTSNFIDAAHLYELMARHIITKCSCASTSTMGSAFLRLGGRLKTKMGVRPKDTDEDSGYPLSSLESIDPGSPASILQDRHEDSLAWLGLVLGAEATPLVLQPRYDQSEKNVKFVILNRLDTFHPWAIEIWRRGAVQHANHAVTEFQTAWSRWARDRAYYWGTRFDKDVDVEEEGYYKPLSLAFRKQGHAGQLKRKRYPNDAGVSPVAIEKCHLNWIPSDFEILGEIPRQTIQEFRQAFDRDAKGSIPNPI